VKRNFGPFEHHQQFGFVGMQPCQQAVEGDEAGLAGEDAVEPCRQGGPAPLGGKLAIGFESAIEPPDQCADFALGDALLIGEGVELVDETLTGEVGWRMWISWRRCSMGRVVRLPPRSER
jgi:hypothetical protein